MPGQRHEPSIPLAADVDIGNVNLLDNAGTKLSGTIGDAADVDGTLVGQLRYIGTAANSTQVAAEGAEDELDGTTITGPLAKIAHTNQTLLFSRVDVDLSSGTQVELIAGVSSVKIYVVEMLLTVSAQCELEFIEASTPCVGAPPMYFPARGGLYLPRSPGYRFVTTTVAEGLDIDEVAGGTVNVRGGIWYYNLA